MLDNEVTLPLSDNLLGQIDRVDGSLLECLNLALKTLNAKEHDTPEAKFNKDFNNFMGGPRIHILLEQSGKPR